MDVATRGDDDDDDDAHEEIHEGGGGRIPCVVLRYMSSSPHAGPRGPPLSLSLSLSLALCVCVCVCVPLCVCASHNTVCVYMSRIWRFGEI